MSKWLGMMMVAAVAVSGCSAAAEDFAVVISVVDGINVRSRHAGALRRAIRKVRPELKVDSIKVRMRQLEVAWDSTVDTFETLVQTRTQQVESVSAQVYQRLNATIAQHGDTGKLKLLVIVMPETGELTTEGPWVIPFGPIGAAQPSAALAQKLAQMQGHVADDLRIIVLGAPLIKDRPEHMEAHLANLLQLLGAQRGSAAALRSGSIGESGTASAASVYQRLKYPSFLVLGGAAAVLAHSIGVTHDFTTTVLIAPAIALVAMVVDEIARFVPKMMARLKRERFGSNVLGRQFRMSRHRPFEPPVNYELRGSDFVVGENDAELFGCERALNAVSFERESIQVIPRVRVRTPWPKDAFGTAPIKR